VTDDRQAWLDRAQMLRQIAVDMDDPVARQELLEIAARWAARAGRADDPIGTSRTAPPPARAAKGRRKGG
jgi:hypothetical protein